MIAVLPRAVLAALLAGTVLGGCAASRGPSADAPGLINEAAPSMTDAEIAAAGTVPEGTPAPSTRPRLFGFLRKRVPGDVAADGSPPPAAAEIETPPVEPSMTDAEIAAAGQVADGTTAPSRRPRLFGFLFKRSPGEGAAPDGSAAPEVIDAALPADEPNQSGESAAVDGQRPGVAPAAPGLLPFGQVLKVCGVRRGDLGEVVARTSGAGGFKLHDTAPSSIAPRTQYLTGFRDGCARQFTASLALFGSPAVHEATRYNPLNASPYSDTDTAYEKVKNRICGVRKGEFCLENRAAKLEKAAAFVSVYKGFGDTGQWVEIFLHKGQLVTYETHVR